MIQIRSDFSGSLIPEGAHNAGRGHATAEEGRMAETKRSAGPAAGCQRAKGKNFMTRLSIVPCDLASAKAFVARVHRHHSPPVGHKFSLAVADEHNDIHGVCIVGRPVSRHLDDGWTLEVVRLATDGCANACSCLYGAAWRVAKEMGYRRLITYILSDEPGTSLKAAGWRLIGERGGGKWSCPSRPRIDKHPTQTKLLFEVSTKESA
jgi:hypothetical protein